MTELTEAERETLRVAGLSDYTVYRKSILAAVTAIIRERERAAGERAWDEGHRACGCFCHEDEPCVGCRNPYLRADRGTSAGGGET